MVAAEDGEGEGREGRGRELWGPVFMEKSHRSKPAGAGQRVLVSVEKQY